ncbi:MAG: anion permease [Myxococcales bacterium]|nr:anion permease [Myxococcales bacterium]
MPAIEGFLSPAQLKLAARWRRVGLVLAPALAAVVWLLRPDNMSHPAAALMALITGTLILWLTEALPLGITALAAPAVGVMLGVATPHEMFAPFANPVVFLFLGAAFLNEGASRRRLDRAVAAALFPRGRTTLTTLVRAFSVVAYVLSSFAPNRSVASMLVPVVRDQAERFGLRFERLALLAVSWSTNIGGMITAVGVPANLVALAAISQYDGRSVPLLHWTLVALPVTAAMMGLWLALSGMVLGPDGVKVVHGDLRTSPQADRRSPTTKALRLPDTVPALWGLDRGQAVLALVIALCLLLWWLPGLVALATGLNSPTTRAVTTALPPGVIALLGAALLFAAPAGRKRNPLTKHRSEPLLTWDEAKTINWDVVLLLGCGLALGHQSIDTGLSQWLGHLAVKGLGVESQIGLTMLMTVTALVMTQFASDTVTAAVLCPLAVVSAQQINVSPVASCLSVGMASSVAVLLPQSTDSSAIVFAVSKLTRMQLAKRGLFAIVAAAILIPTITVGITALLGLN